MGRENGGVWAKRRGGSVEMSRKDLREAKGAHESRRARLEAVPQIQEQYTRFPEFVKI